MLKKHKLYSRIGLKNKEKKTFNIKMAIVGSGWMTGLINGK